MNKKPDERLKDAMNTDNLGEADFEFSFWFGAVILFVFHLGRRPFEDFYDRKYLVRNTLLGWGARMLFIFGTLYFLWFLATR